MILNYLIIIGAIFVFKIIFLRALCPRVFPTLVPTNIWERRNHPHRYVNLNCLLEKNICKLIRIMIHIMSVAKKSEQYGHDCIGPAVC